MADTQDISGAQGWTEWCLSRIAAYETAAGHDPLTNSVRQLAHDVLAKWLGGEMTSDDIAGVTKVLTSDALIARADEFADRHRASGPSGFDLTQFFQGLEGLTFAEAKQRLERNAAGIVFTAHPTFAMSPDLSRAFTDYASAAADEDRTAIKARIPDLIDRRAGQITLTQEHVAAHAAIAHAKDAVRQLTHQIFEWARQAFPDNWTQLAPKPVSVASWVGYDLDGRTDIHWSQSLSLRLGEKAQQLSAYAHQLGQIELGQTVSVRDRIVSRLEGAASLAHEQASLFKTDGEDVDGIAAAANHLSSNDPRRLVSLDPVLADIDGLVADAPDDPARQALCVLKTEMQSYGLGASLVHFRINAAQVRSALRAEFDFSDEREFDNRTTFALAASKAKNAAPRRVSIASIFLEQMTAHRQLMLCAQVLKHIDSDAPIRFLIAECESPATIMGAVYLARLYGVDHRLDISPLFETPEAIERGGRFIERLLDEEEYVSYIKERGCLSAQFGFSDSGRFMGQVAANIAIERLQILIVRALAARDIRGVDVILFNTHGESMGRGGFPGTLPERFDYLFTPWARARYAKEGVHVVAESSFQGGDGYLHFATPQLASATLQAIVSASSGGQPADHSDQFYTDINFSWDVYRGVKTWQETLFDHPDYQVMIGAFASSFLPITGSRKVRRQSGNTVVGPRALRAIPHNAILQQLGAPANVFGGIGTAIHGEEERFVDQVKHSARALQLLTIAQRARAVTSIPAMRAYAPCFSPTFWISKAALEEDADLQLACEEIAAQLTGVGIDSALNGAADVFASDLIMLDRVLMQLAGPNYRDERHAQRRAIHVLHAIRQAYIMRGFLLAAKTPSFSRRHGMSRSELFKLAFAAEFDELAAVLTRIFPADDMQSDILERVEEVSEDLADEDLGYPKIHNEIIQPLRDTQAVITQITAGLAHFYKAFG